MNMTVKDWIDIKDKQPAKYQNVAFVVDSTDEAYNNRVLGGRYQGNQHGYYGFTTPGIEFAGKYWFPLPDAPNS